MDYNTTREKLILPEYGRNIQKLIKHAISIKDREKRNNAAKGIIAIMGNMNPQLREMVDFKHKLWDHLTIISEFNLDVDSPYEKPPINAFAEKPKKIPYNINYIRYKHYGRTIEKLIDKACTFEEGEEKEALIEVIANHMKKAYLTWNREAITDHNIIHDVRQLSNNRLVVPDDLKLIDAKIIVKGKRKRTNRKK